jgi:hypothetical protein
MTPPIVNLNGNSQESLMKDVYEAMKTVKSAFDAVQSMDVHGRNYPNGDYQTAREEWISILTRLNDIHKELDEYALAIVEQKR